MKIVGGMSTPRSISIFSDEFVATATYHGRSQQIRCVVHRRVATWLTRYPWIPIPRVLRLLIALVMASPILMTALIAWPVAHRIIDGPTPQFPPIPLEDRLFVFLLVQSQFLPLLVGILLFIKLFIGSWHAAEHMAIASYERFASTDLAAIAAQNRVHPKCGGRLMAPLLLASFLAFCFGPINHLFLSQLALIECILWIDALIGFDKIPVFRILSTLLQHYITTRTPHHIALRTAQVALQKLVAAHANAATQGALSPTPSQ